MIGYFASEYPSISHTFIRREVIALRRRGLEIRTFSIHRPPSGAPFGESDRREREQTSYLQPPGIVSTLAAHFRELLRSPLRYFRALAIALHHRTPGVRATVWSFFYFAEGAILADRLRRERIHHLHVHFAHAGADVARVACYLCGISWSLTLHGTADFEYPAVLTLGDKLRTARFTACASYFVRAQALRKLDPQYWDRLGVVRCGVEIPEHPARVSHDGPTRILCVGRLSPEKGHHGLLRALAELRGSVPPFRVTFVGDGPMRADLESRARELGLSDAVVFAGARSEEDVMEFLASSDLFVLASLMEGLPVVLMEAMAFGLAVIAPRVAGIPELVDDQCEGLLFQPSDWEALKLQLRRMLEQADLRERLGAAGRVRVAREFAIERAVEPLLRRFSSDVG
ncbi:MAG: glycosyltransferase family 4 protein [Myxococcota bacterium]